MGGVVKIIRLFDGSSTGSPALNNMCFFAFKIVQRNFQIASTDSPHVGCGSRDASALSERKFDQAIM